MRVKVKPKAGVTVKDKLGRLINPAGQMVCDSSFIRRLIKEGALELMDTKQAVVDTTPKKKKENS